MKARRVKGLRPDMPLADAAERIVRVRLDELYSFMPRALDPKQTRALHDLRIAAKRLRYVLEVSGPCFGRYAEKAGKRARDIQDIVGEIHDCDVQLPQVLELVDELRERDAGELRRAAGESEDLDPHLASQAEHRSAYRGLDVLAVHLQARRDLLFERFLELWDGLERQRFRARLEAALGERPDDDPPTAPPSLDDGHSEHADALRSAIGDLAR